ncbi:bifunctional methylenetetrahydrofolate dehydrogenase/methenyltetrahydrofolate cyclohydrolase FolD [Paenibacillus pasadenensis]|uniref:Bifunctional protein FolD n=1 Tax=Paenibacillus pasadenensis TaxID=217090 RepID=A0A2N5N5E6_9BACL|nr:MULTISPECIES: bifunctional methylenetetrahydrofolate dehydrogenase/methenyltetrahydrofolate cyclohydrolase FolD [Paenibacillus]PLT45555.1 Methylenetetrahydrofolate dehydrogenase (NADP+) [Paenibacillus pasadenensis]QGG56017.1 bifunctional methylenetetrahydrofolate dehydrogenase/methenyltetrahydrofolate cyclohydrolase FolD [Paenibacillus sp. B01]
MSAKVIDGKRIAQEIREEIRLETARLKERGIVPGLAVVLVGGDPASAVYVGSKEKTCKEMGFHSEVHRLPEETTEEQLLALVSDLNRNEAVHGILVQLPLPKHIHEKAVIDAIAVEKDVDGFSPQSTGNLVIGDESLLPCTPAGIIELIRRAGVDPAGKHAVVIGRSNIVGKPVAMLLLRENATVTICHSRTDNMEAIASQADILVVAIGKPKAIGRRYVKPGAVVIDVGVNRLETGKLAGDVDYDDCLDVAGAITPVPGGVGPMTIAMLMQNTLKAAKRKAGV